MGLSRPPSAPPPARPPRATPGCIDASPGEALLSRAQKEQHQRKDRKELLGLATHGLSYTIVIGGLTLMDLFSGPSWWVHWPALGWGIGLAFHAMGTVMGMAKRELKVEDDE